ncbi:MAG: isochorismate synthase [Flavobacteriaceae bacterium]|nr:isochorismate synthase [Flavobacteriaceae bacterium]|tara:strand:+ start:287 stop:1357 length:1071 start_codon:yes stop_codon:yes gene_type:complete
MLYSQLVEKVLGHFEQNLPFVLYSLPDVAEIVGIFQNNDDYNTSQVLHENGFAFAPFHSHNETVQISLKSSEMILCNDLPEILKTDPEFIIKESPDDKKGHIALVSKTKAHIKAGKAQKIVVSRKKEVVLQKFNLKTLCDSLFSQNPSAFRYTWYHPRTALWCGATPEVLIKTNGSAFSTMALAGTQKIDGKSMLFWAPKEKNEQKWVVDAIVENLLDKTTALNISKTKTHIAGNLAHLCTDIKGVLTSSKYALQKVVEALHPTPAVCGTPRKAAQNFIIENEGYTREFYTGFLGIVNNNKHESELFVNLRCIKIEGSTATLYAGGGITEDSIPEDEWEETHNKLQTMAKVIQPLL